MGKLNGREENVDLLTVRMFVYNDIIIQARHVTESRY